MCVDNAMTDDSRLYLNGKHLQNPESGDLLFLSVSHSTVEKDLYRIIGNDCTPETIVLLERIYFIKHRQLYEVSLFDRIFTPSYPTHCTEISPLCSPTTFVILYFTFVT